MNRIAALLIAGAVLGIVAAGRAPVANAQPVPTASPSDVPASPSPQATGYATPMVSPTPPPGSAASPGAALPGYNYVYRPASAPSATPPAGPNPPQIAEIDVSDATIVTPGAIRVRVLTSTAVTSVIANTFGRTIAIPQQQPGIFALATSIPDVPFFLKNRTYNIEFVAAVPDGRAARVTVPLTLR